MNDINKQYDSEGCNFPENKIVLLDGRELACFPLAVEEQGKVEENKIDFDTTGRYLTIGNAPRRKKEEVPAEVSASQKLFIENALFILDNRKRILADSRMFLCPIAIENGLAYTGTSGFRSPTLGVYLEWWNACEGTLRVDDDGVRSLVYHIAGSPLSGTNRCTAIREDGTSEKVSLQPFSKYWLPFTKINKRYDIAKARYQAYDLQEVLALLGRTFDKI